MNSSLFIIFSPQLLLFLLVHKHPFFLSLIFYLFLLLFLLTLYPVSLYLFYIKHIEYILFPFSFYKKGTD